MHRREDQARTVRASRPGQRGDPGRRGDPLTQLLELSGIGRADVPRTIGVPVRRELAGVGENYHDHYALRMNWRLQGIHSLNESTRGWRLAAAVAQYAVRRTGILTLGPALCHGS